MFKLRLDLVQLAFAEFERARGHGRQSSLLGSMGAIQMRPLKWTSDAFGLGASALRPDTHPLGVDGRQDQHN